MLKKKLAIGLFKRHYHHIIGLLVIIALLAIMHSHYITGEKIRMSDPGNYLSVGYNLAKYWHFGQEVSEEGEIIDKGYYYQEPAYPFYLSIIFHFSEAFNGLSLKCLYSRVVSSSEPCETASDSLKASKVIMLVNTVNFVVICLLVFVGIISCKILLDNWILAYLSGVLLIPFLPNFDQDILRNLLLILHSIFCYKAFVDLRRRIIFGVLSGISLGLLSLSAPVFLYYIYVLGFISIASACIALLRIRKGDWPNTIVFLIVITSLIVIGPWLVRNYHYGKQIAISGRGGLNLAQRLEYLTRDVISEGRFLNFSPSPFYQIAHMIIPYNRINITNNASFVGKAVTIALVRGLIEEGLLSEKHDIFNNNFPPYERGGINKEYDRMRKKAYAIIENHVFTINDTAGARQAKLDKLLLKGDISILTDNFWRHTFLYTPLYAIRGSQYMRNMEVTKFMVDMKPLAVLNPWLFPSLLLVCFYSIWKKKYGLFMFFLPALFCHLFLSFFIIYMLRYNQQFISISIISLVFSIYLLFKYLMPRRKSHKERC